jgi:hypothetical protein
MAELYNPATDQWRETGYTTSPHAVHTATLLRDGSVPLPVTSTLDGYGTSSTAERYRPATGAWENAGTMGPPRALHTATRLLDDRVLIAGGRRAGGGTLAMAELFAG